MLKRVLCTLCSLVLMVSFVTASAATVTEHTLESKLQKQLISSGLNGQITFSATGDRFENTGALRWTMLKSILSGAKVNVSSSVLHSSREDRETTVQLMMNDAEVGKADILNNGERFAFNSNMLNENGLWFTFPADMDFLAGNSWPSIWTVLFRILNADAAWQKRASEAAAPYYARLGIWLQDYQEITTETQDDGVHLLMHCEIPATAVVSEMKNLMAQLYADETCLAVLSEALTAREASVYLSPSYSATFSALLDMMTFNGNVIIDRVYDAQGLIQTERITLPFTDSYQFSHITFSQTKNADGMEYALSGAYRPSGHESNEDGLYAFLISMTPAGEEGIWNGTASIAYPLVTDTTSYEVVEEAEENTQGHFETSFALGFVDEEETYEAKQDLSTRASHFTLTLRPIDGDTTGMHVTSIALSYGLSSKSKATSPTSLTGELSITDQETGASIGMEWNFRTAVRWEPMLIENLPANVVNLNELNKDEFEIIKADWLRQLTAWFGSLTTEALGR